MISHEVGDTRELVVHQLTVTHLVNYAGASGDFNPIHDAAARAAGYPGLFGHGMFSMGLTSRLLTDWFGPSTLTSYGVRFTRQLWPGDTLTARGEMTAIVDGVATVDVPTTNQDGEPVVSGTATIAL